MGKALQNNQKVHTAACGGGQERVPTIRSGAGRDRACTTLPLQPACAALPHHVPGSGPPPHAPHAVQAPALIIEER